MVTNPQPPTPNATNDDISDAIFGPTEANPSIGAAGQRATALFVTQTQDEESDSPTTASTAVSSNQSQKHQKSYPPQPTVTIGVGLTKFTNL
jgi:hypothetical protein